jgi:hypothetical protein
MNPGRSITFRGQTQTLTAWAQQTGIPFTTLWDRIAKNGWTVKRALTTPRRAMHGASGTPEHRVWKLMNARCQPMAVKRHIYFERGIAVCVRWRRSFAAFFADVGPRPSPQHSIDRIKNHLGYRPGNVRWATAKQQSHNSRSVQLVAAEGKRLPIAEWARRKGLAPPTLYDRLSRGWSINKALNTPARRS